MVGRVIRFPATVVDAHIKNEGWLLGLWKPAGPRDARVIESLRGNVIDLLNRERGLDKKIERLKEMRTHLVNHLGAEKNPQDATKKIGAIDNLLRYYKRLAVEEDADIRRAAALLLFEEHRLHSTPTKRFVPT